MTALTVTDLNRMGADCLPGHLGIAITHADKTEVRAEMGVSMKLMAPNGYLHAGSVVLEPRASPAERLARTCDTAASGPGRPRGLRA